jgi:hypothetical protein
LVCVINISSIPSWPGISRSKNGVASLAYVPAIHDYAFRWR